MGRLTTQTRKSIRSGALALSLFTPLIWNGLSFAKEYNWQSGIEQTHLLELYSSEGCSSCPPADRWFAELKKDKDLWKKFIPIAFQVDYWNRLGWTDPYSDKKYSKRQYRYAKEWGNGRVYTPGFVLSGNEWRKGSGPDYKSGKRLKAGKLSATYSSKGTLTVTFKPAAKKTGQYRIFVSLLGHNIKTEVPRGENAGEILRHEFVALSLDQSSMTSKKKGTYQSVIHLKPTKKGANSPQARSIAVWVATSDRLAPLQAVGGWLN